MLTFGFFFAPVAASLWFSFATTACYVTSEFDTELISHTRLILRADNCDKRRSLLPIWTEDLGGHSEMPVCQLTTTLAKTPSSASCHCAKPKSLRASDRYVPWCPCQRKRSDLARLFDTDDDTDASDTDPDDSDSD